MSWWADGRSGSPGVVVSADCRSVRRALRPVVWVVLEEIALDAELDGNARLVARSSARRVAEQLGVNPTTVAEALRVLGRRGLISLEREKGPDGRFGLSAYQLRPPAGLMVVPPCMAEPRTVSPSMVPPGVGGAAAASSDPGAPDVKASGLEPATSGRLRIPAAGADTASISAASGPDSSAATAWEGSLLRRDRSTVSPGSSGHCPGQTALDLGMGSS